MSKINKGQKVRVIKPGIFNEAIGTIVSVSYKVDFGALGEWTFGENDLLPFANGMVGESPIITKSVDPVKLSETADINKQQPEKRAYNKHPKDKLVKEKRKYSPRKPKII